MWKWMTSGWMKMRCCLLKSLVRHSSHPLSQALYQSIPGDILKDVDDFREIPALGLAGMVDGHIVKAGSESFVTGAESEFKSYTSRVFVSVDGRLTGS